MSKISLTPNASGTGTFTIASPNSNTNRTLTLPDADGALLTSNGDGSGLTSLTAGNLTGTLPAIDGSALTGIDTTPTATQVLTANAGASAGAVGTYANVVHYGGELNFGDTIAGSSVHPVSISKGNDYTYRITSYVAFGSLESALSGTWRVMASGAYSGTRSYSFLALRIS